MSATPATLRESVPGLASMSRRFRPYVRAERRLVAGGFAALIVEVAMRLLEPWPLKFVVDGVVAAASPSTGAAERAHLQTVFALAALGVVLFAGLRALSAYLMTTCFALAGNRVLTQVRSDVYAHLQSLSMAFHDSSRTGDLVTRVTGDVGRLKDVTITAALPLLGNIVTLLGMMIVVAVLDLTLALVMLVVFPAFAVVGVRLGRKVHQVSRTQRRAEGALASHATETLSSMRVVQSYSLEGRMQSRFASSNAKSLRDGVKGARLAAGLERKTDVLVGLATGLVLFVGANRVIAGALTPGDLVVFLTYLKAAFKPMRDLAKYTGRIAQAAASGERIVDLLDQQPHVVDGSALAPTHGFTGSFSLTGVELAYEPGHPILRGLDLQVQAGERVAIVGPSGAGKSTLAMLLSRLRDPDQGSVRLDDVDVRALPLSLVRSQVSIVLQESLLFAVTIRENIAWGSPDATDDEVDDAARLAFAHDFICNLPHGYDTVVGERGTTLSGGQRQRIAIARAAVRQAPIVVLDEAMSGLDVATERDVVAALDRLTRGRTTLVITHDLEAARNADRVVWVERGRVLRQGTAADVLDVYEPTPEEGVRDAVAR